MLEIVLTHIFAGEQGKVDESMREMAAIEALKSEKADKEVRYQLPIIFMHLKLNMNLFTFLPIQRELQQLTDTSGASGHQKLRVCDVCGAYLSVLDSDRRLADHFGGKMHLGYHELRNMLQKFKEEREKRKTTAPASSAAPGGGRPGDRDYRSSKDEYRDRDRDRGYDRDRHSSRHE